MPQGEPPLPEKKEQFERGLEAWTAGDFDGWLADTHPDFEYEPGMVIGPAQGGGVLYRGRERLRRMFDEFHALWQMEFALDELEEIGDSTVFLGRARMTGVQSGASVEQKVGWVVQFEGRQVRRMWSYQGHEAARAAAGA